MGSTNRKWRSRGDTNGVPIRNVNPKVNLLGAVDSRGGIYHACTTTNTNSLVFKVFMSYLHEQVKSNYPEEMEKVRYVLDGAGYHKSKATRLYFQ